MRTIRRGGDYLRIADPAWSDPLDGAVAGLRGGRWNAPGEFAIVYLNASVEVARANVYRRLRGQPYGPEDLDPATAPVLVATSVPEGSYVDAVTNRGCVSAGLPQTYPVWRNGVEVGDDTCRPVGLAAWAAEKPGIACRSATRAGEELAWFQRRRRLRPRATKRFDGWFWPQRPENRPSRP